MALLSFFITRIDIQKMDTFYLIVLGMATLILIGALAFVGWTMSNTKKGERYPLVQTQCPDNWTIDKDANGNTVCNIPAAGQYNRGNSQFATDYINASPAITTISPTSTTAPSDWSTVCKKKEWAAKYGVYWDSVENANYCS